MSHELSFKQWHHGYLGIIMIAIGVIFALPFTTWLGGYVLLDDLLQHLIQWKWDDAYASPLRYLYNKWIWEPLHDEEVP